MSRIPAVLIVAVPHSYATALAMNLDRDAAYAIYHPNVAGGDELPEMPFDVAITNLPIPTGCARVHIRLPDTTNDPLLITAEETSLAVQPQAVSYVVELVALVKKYAFGEEAPPASVI